MAKTVEIWVNRNAIDEAKIVDVERPDLQDGEVRVSVDKFALTANNVSYAVSGEAIGYWQFFPAEGDWGIVPMWGFGKVIESRCEGVELGARFYGYFPFASEAILTPAKLTARGFSDASVHRSELPGVYNDYSNTAGDTPQIAALEDERCLYFPLFITSFVLSDYLEDNAFFGASQTVIGSASSKTGFGLAAMLKANGGSSRKVIGLTSPGNVAFVESLGWYDQIVTYDALDSLDASQPTAFVDMSGNGPMREQLHHHFGDNLVESCMVGATHWETDRRTVDLPGAKPAFFFAPAQIAKRNKEWGPGKLMARAYGASAGVANQVAGQISVKRLEGAQAALQAWQDMVANKVSPKDGLILKI